MAKRLKNQKGQTAVEFTLMLPFFLLMFFTLLLFCLRVIYAELTLYAGFVGERAAMVGASDSDALTAARSILPGVDLDITRGGSSSTAVPGLTQSSSGDSSLTTTASYRLESILGQSGNKSLDSPLAKAVELQSHFGTVEFINCSQATQTDDNPVGSGSC